jgi:type IV pilus assembly protein PilA
MKTPKFIPQSYQLEQGFTLIELLVVVLMIGALSAIALPSYLNQAAKARASEARSALGAINRAQQVYYLERGTMTGNPSDLSVKVSPKFYIYQLNLVDQYTAESTARISPTGSVRDLKQYDSAVQVNTTNDFFGQIICESLEINQNPGGATAPAVPGSRGSCNPVSGKILD